MQGYPFALNEVAVLKHDSSSMISIRVDVDGEYLTTYQADGLIVNTPSGSTAYALSVGGSVMLPGCQIIGLVPVAPHGLTVRPLTLPDNLELTLTVESRSHNFLVAIDGRSESCQDSQKLIIRKAPYQVQVLKRPETTFLHTLRSKLLWGSDARTAPTNLPQGGGLS
jgi:NAD+ kinase